METTNKYIYEYERWYEYDDKGNMIHSKDSNRFEGWYEYDDNGNCIHSKNSIGYEIWNEYNENGNCIYSKLLYVKIIETERWYEYDDKGNMIHSKDSNGFEFLLRILSSSCKRGDGAPRIIKPFLLGILNY